MEAKRQQARTGVGRWRVALPAKPSRTGATPAFLAFLAKFTQDEAHALLLSVEYALSPDVVKLLFPTAPLPNPPPLLPALPEWPYDPSEYSSMAAPPFQFPKRTHRK